MRFKVGDKWYETTPNNPIMIEFENESEQLSIAAMPQGKTRFASFHYDDEWPEDKRLAWMNEGAKVQASELKSMKLEPGSYTIEVTKKVSRREAFNEIAEKLTGWVASNIDDKGKDE